MSKTEFITEDWFFIDGFLQGIMSKLEDFNPENVEKEKWIMRENIAVIEKSIAKLIQAQQKNTNVVKNDV